MNDPHKLKARVLEKAHELGFDLVGITGAEPPPHLEVYRAWLQSGRHASMEYLAAERALARRADPRRILPECRSIIVKPRSRAMRPASHPTRWVMITTGC
jgi:epoxyqueuosine reductase QueG